MGIKHNLPQGQKRREEEEGKATRKGPGSESQAYREIRQGGYLGGKMGC